MVRRDDKQDNVVFGRVPWELLLGKDTGASASTVDAYEDKIGEDVVIYAQLFRGRDFLNKFLGDLFIPMNCQDPAIITSKSTRKIPYMSHIT